jgi:hypothetical protein
MSKKALLIGAAVAGLTFAGGFALAQPMGHGPGFQHGGQGPGQMRGEGPRGMGHGMGPGMMRHGGQGMGQGMGPGGMHGGQGAAFADPARIETLKTELAITSQQEAAWTKYAKTVQDVATEMKTFRDNLDRNAIRNMTPEDRAKFMTDRQAQRQKNFETVQKAATELLAALDETQKTKAQGLLPGLRGPGFAMMQQGGPQGRGFGPGGGPRGHRH